MNFKTGDKGKTRGGADYEVIVVLDPPLNSPGQESVGAILSTSVYPRWYFENGQFVGHVSEDDLMPPNVVKGWLCVQRSGKVTFYSGAQAHCCNPNDPAVGKIHIDQEYEPYERGGM